MLINTNKKLSLVLLVIFFLYSCGGGENRQVKYLERAKNYFDEKFGKVKKNKR